MGNLGSTGRAGTCRPSPVPLRLVGVNTLVDQIASAANVAVRGSVAASPADYRVRVQHEHSGGSERAKQRQGTERQIKRSSNSSTHCDLLILNILHIQVNPRCVSTAASVGGSAAAVCALSLVGW